MIKFGNVILSEAKNPHVAHERFFAEFTLSAVNGLRMTLPILVAHIHQMGRERTSTL